MCKEAKVWEILSTWREDTLAAMQNAFEASVAKERTYVRTEMIKLTLKKRGELQDTVEATHLALNHWLEAQYEETEQIVDPAIRSVEMERLDDLVICFRELSETPIKEFEVVALKSVGA